MKKNECSVSHNFANFMVVLFFVSIYMCIGCSQRFNLLEIDENTAKDSEFVTLSLSATTEAARTIGYVLPEIGHYELFGKIRNSDNPIKSLGVWISLESATVSLQSEIWDLTLTAYDTAEENPKSILQGTRNQIDISESTSIVFTLQTVESGTGFVQVSLSWPISESVSSCTVSFGSEGTKTLPFSSNDTNSSVIYSNIQATAGDQWIIFILRDSSSTILAYVKELVRVRENLTSSAELFLSLDDFNTVPSVPSNVTSTYLGISDDETYSFLVSWVDTSLVETGFDISVDDGLSVYSSVAAGVTETTIAGLPASDLYSFSVSSKNSIGNSNYISTTNTKHTLSFNANGGTGEVMAPMTAFEGQALTLPLNSYIHSESTYTFNSWCYSTDDIEVYIDDEGAYTMGGCDVTLYAQWTLSQGISATVSYPDDSTQITCISDTDNFTVTKGNSITFSVNEEFSTYEWSSYTNSGCTINLGSGSTATLDTSELTIGQYFVILKVTDQNGFNYSTTVKITIQSVDSIPASVSNLSASYSVVEEKILVKWIDPVDTDLQNIVLTCAKAGETSGYEEQVQTITAGIQVCEFAQIVKDDSAYTITVITQDLANNMSEENSITVMAANYAYINSINLDKKHFDVEMENRIITATLNGANLSETDSIKVKMTEGSDTTLKTASITSSLEAVVTFEAPQEIADYTVEVILNDEPVTDVSAIFTVTESANFTGLFLAFTQFEAGISGRIVRVTISGTNLDIRKPTLLKVVDSNGAIVSTHEVCFLSDTELTADVTVPRDEADYSVQCWVDDVLIECALLQVYGIPIISNLYIPPQKFGTEGEPIPVYIKGINLNIGDGATIVISPGDITATILGAKSAIAYISAYSDCEVTAKLNTINVDNISAQLKYYEYAEFTKQLIPIDTFKIANCEVTYALWYEVYQWALGNEYNFVNLGSEGNDGKIGAAPTSSDQYQPVSMISWRDVIVWCNAYSQYKGKTSVYYSDELYTSVWCNSDSDTNGIGDIEDFVFVNSSADGYRLPTQKEWEYAARGANLVGPTWEYPYAGSQTCKTVAWYETNSDDETGLNETKDVAKLAANGIGLYDMCGNIREWVDTMDSDSVSSPLQCGGSFKSSAGDCKITESISIAVDKIYYYYGFRVACSVQQ